MTTRRERVLDALELASTTGRLSADGQRQHRCADGWVDGWLLCHPSIGGSEGLRRVRELRADGHSIETREHPTQGNTTQQYRLAPAERLF